MSQQPKTETDRLANVIQVLQLGQKTGRLVVERNTGSTLEQGIITFVNGQIVQASVNQQQGLDALNWLRSWGHCRFAFLLDQRPGNAGQMPSLPPQVPVQGNGLHQRNPPSLLPKTATGPLYSQQDLANRLTGKLGAQRVPTAWLTIPYRTRHIEEGMRLIEHMGLSRTHRRLFLLIDGRRTLKELVRLMAHEPAEVLRFLQELERAGVIQL